MFWVNYDEISNYLGRMPVMTSNYNNVSNMSINDFFVTHRYKGDIYKTTNLRNLTLAQYCNNDSSAVSKEQERIEGELQTFERNLWAAPVKEEPVDTTAVAVDTKEKKSKKSSRLERRASSDENKKVEKKKESSASSPAAPRVSVRRQRR